MIIGAHLILGTYGFWLPNDPRGSHSKFVWSDEIAKHGEATTVEPGRSRASDPHNVQKRLAAKKSLKYPEVNLTGKQALMLANGIAEAVGKYDFELLAFSILEQHLHCVAVSETMKFKKIVRELKRYGSNRLTRSKKHPLYEYRKQNRGRIPTIWTGGFWKVYIESEQQLQNAIHYVEQNPIKDGKRQQHWSFVSKPNF